MTDPRLLPDELPMSRAETMRFVDTMVAAVNTHDIPGILALYADDAVTVSPVFGTIQGREAIEHSWKDTFSSLTDWTVEVQDVLVDGNRIAIVGTSWATDRQGWFGQPATGERIHIGTVIILTLARRLIVRDERTYDMKGVVDRLEKSRIDKDLKLAAEMQRILLPRLNSSSRFSETAADSIPCRAIGGDFFELLSLPSGEQAIVLGDVAGKGPASALIAAMLQGMISSEIHRDPRPAAVLDRLNRALVRRSLQGKFATLVYALLSPDGSLVYSNAGHNPPLLLEPDGSIRRLGCGGTIAGIFESATFEEESIPVLQGSSLTMFSDGVTESTNSLGEEFGEARLTACLKRYRDGSAATMLEAVLNEVREFCRGSPQNDDITLTVTRLLHSSS